MILEICLQMGRDLQNLMMVSKYQSLCRLVFHQNKTTTVLGDVVEPMIRALGVPAA